MTGIYAVSGPVRMSLFERINTIKSLVSLGHVDSAEHALEFLSKEIYKTEGTDEILELFYGDFKEVKQ